MKNLVVTGILMAFCAMPLQAQFLKKLQKKIEQKVENTVTNKVADKAADEAGKSVDKMLNFPTGNSENPMGYEPVDHADIPDVYDFEWSYIMKMETKEGDITMNYFLKKDAPYFGFKLPENDMHIVMDPSKNLNVMFMTSEGNRMVMATKIPEISPDEMPEDLAKEDEFSFKKIGNKTIMGYDCTGYQGENDDMIFTFYITTEPDISFASLYNSDNANLPKGFDPDWIEDANGIMMQMNMDGKKNSKDNVTMTCIALERKPYSLKKSDYNSMAGN